MVYILSIYVSVYRSRLILPTVFRKVFCMKRMISCVAFFAVLFLTTAIHAEYVNINEGKDKQLYNIFNNYMGLTGEDAYKSSNDLFADRGVTATNWSVGEDASVYAYYRNANFTHEVYSTDANGNRDGAFSMVYDKNANTSAITNLGDSAISLESGDVSWAMNVYQRETPPGSISDGNLVHEWLADSSQNNDGMTHLVAFDVTDLLSAFYTGDADVISAYLFAWEDQSLFGDPGNRNPADFDYADFVYIMINVAPTSAATPEPSTALVFGAAMIGLPFAYRRMRRNKKA